MSSNAKRHCPDSSVTAREFSVEEAQRIQEKLNLKLGPEYVSYRPAPGGTRVAYVEGWAMLNLANDIFGFNGWSSSIVDTTVDEEGGKISLGISCTVRVYLKDGTFHEDIGYGTSDNQRSKGVAYEKAKKEAVTDGIKRALRYFGNCLGNCTYDKSFIKDIKGMSIPQKTPIHADQFLRSSKPLDRTTSESYTTHKNELLSNEIKEIFSDTEIYNENEEALNLLFNEALVNAEVTSETATMTRQFEPLNANPVTFNQQSILKSKHSVNISSVTHENAPYRPINSTFRPNIHNPTSSTIRGQKPYSSDHLRK